MSRVFARLKMFYKCLGVRLRKHFSIDVIRRRHAARTPPSPILWPGACWEPRRSAKGKVSFGVLRHAFVGPVLGTFSAGSWQVLGRFSAGSRQDLGRFLAWRFVPDNFGNLQIQMQNLCQDLSKMMQQSTQNRPK